MEAITPLLCLRPQRELGQDQGLQQPVNYQYDKVMVPNGQIFF